MAGVHNNKAQHRFELAVGDAIAFVAYRRTEDTVTLTHTEVPEALSGQGIGSRLVRGVLDQLREDAVRVVPVCEFVAQYIERHPEYRSLTTSD